jgi:hypothetical protein
MIESFDIGTDRFTRIGAATYNGLPKIFWQHWIHQDRAWVLNGTKCIHPKADQAEVMDSFMGYVECEY